ncbi:hypothetical protein ISN45_Aa08g019620 [Arabidopsis thaliana x Arabidopsis arenosa]|uniref:Late embryogenesis abundant protein LEA-2 subgroup domain-containing protein n=1 Tax=Arabidopsis thaliana x Arabidopsis arenosa TaxID=1240361 RepID=A0A8T1XIJ1_9BRAS|nr:hypothetical protein ISN45_Aa08g019620 [Arabidopsis thaliana x Arabidopsis arenosa]
MVLFRAVPRITETRSATGLVLLRLRSSRTSPWIWCGAALCFLFSILLIVFGISTLILFPSVRPRTLVVDISNAKLNTILFGSPVYFDGDMLLQLNFTNPNKKQSVRLENLSVELWFADTKIATQGVLPFSLRNVKAVLGIIHYSYWLKGSCQLQLTSPPAGSLLSRNCTTKRW